MIKCYKSSHNWHCSHSWNVSAFSCCHYKCSSLGNVLKDSPYGSRGSLLLDDRLSGETSLDTLFSSQSSLSFSLLSSLFSVWTLYWDAYTHVHPGYINRMESGLMLFTCILWSCVRSSMCKLISRLLPGLTHHMRCSIFGRKLKKSKKHNTRRWGWLAYDTIKEGWMFVCCVYIGIKHAYKLCNIIA